MRKQMGLFWLAVAALAAGCAAPAPGGSERTGRATEAGPVAAPKRITLGIARDLPTLKSHLSRVAASALPGTREVEQLVHVGLAISDEQRERRPQLAEAVPTLENGLWTLSPDGRMELVWRINPRAQWQDGTPFTAEDLVFTARVGRDRELPQFRDIAYESLESVEAVDPLVVKLTWHKPFIDADALFSGFYDLPSLPLPRHLLEHVYLENKPGFTDLPYWGSEFVGTGPYVVREWVRGSHLTLAANERYVLGRPKIDEIVVRIIVDTNALLVNIIAGAVEMPLQGRFSLHEILQVRNQWPDGHVEIIPSNSVNLFPQLRVPNPVVITDLRFRRALLQAIDRQQMADALASGLSSASHTTIVPGTPEYEVLQHSVVRYEHDPRGAAAIVQELGYTLGPDGMFRDAAGAPLRVEVRSDGIDTLQSAALSAADYWQRFGVGVDMSITPIQRQADLEYRATFPGFDTTRSAGGLRGFMSFHSSQVRLPENRFTGSNFPGYANPEYDALVARYQMMIPRAERMQAAGQIVHHITGQLLLLPLYYTVTSTMVGPRLKNVPSRVPMDLTVT